MAGGESDAERRERLRASREIGRALRLVQTIRALYVISAVLFAILAATAVSLEGYVVAAILAAMAVAMLIGAPLVRQSPGIWSVIMASIISSMVVLEITTSTAFTTHSIWGAAIALALWCAVPLAFRAEVLLEEHPDLYIAQKWTRRRRSARRSEIGERVQQETRRQKQAARRKAFVFGGCFVAFLLVMKFAPLGGDAETEESVEPAPRPEFGTRGVDFMVAWNSGDWAAIERFLHPEDRRRTGTRIRRLMKRRGWDKRPPRMKPPRVVDKGKVWTYYTFEDYEPDVVYKVRWAHEDGVWWYDAGKWPRTEDVKR